MSLQYRNKLVRIQIFLKYHFDLHKHKNDMHAHIKLDLIDTQKKYVKRKCILLSSFKLKLWLGNIVNILF